MSSQQQIVAAVRASGHRLTRQRAAIIEYLARRGNHPTVRQIFEALRSRGVQTSLATVYNTLATLVELGFLEELEFGSKDNRYDTNVLPHINLVCDVCGSITDFDRKPPASPEEIERTIGFATGGIRMEYHGVCATCRSEEHDASTGGP